MIFSEPSFLFLFLPLALLCFLSLQRNWFLCSVIFWSFFFYYLGSGIDVYILVFSATFNWLAGLGAKNKFFLSFAVVINLLLLIIYKYSYFFAASVFQVSSEALLANLEALELPIGISFFTFQAISYLVDVHRGDAEASKLPLKFFAYLSFFPQLIAGPIVRYKDVVGDLMKPKRSIDMASLGVARFSHGLFKKVVLADTFGKMADYCFGLEEAALSPSLAWIGTLSYTLQIYFDFSAYSDMAIGIAAIAGIRIQENFLRPYSSSTITEFWRRWHISLSSWFRDYLYIPLGGNRRGAISTVINLALVFLFCGLWHGAAWTFLLWGLFHGCFLGAEKIILGKKAQEEKGLLFRLLYFLPITLVSWLLFRSESIEQFCFILKNMLFLGVSAPASAHSNVSKSLLAWNEFIFNFNYLEVWGLVACSTIFLLPRHFSFSNFQKLSRGSALEALKIAYSTLALIIALVAALTSSYTSFLYFRF